MATSTIPKADLIVVSASQTKSVAPGAERFYLAPTIPSGYKGICVAGFNINYAECSINICEWDGTQLVVNVRNNHTTALSVAVTAYLLCYKG